MSMANYVLQPHSCSCRTTTGYANCAKAHDNVIDLITQASDSAVHIQSSQCNICRNRSSS
eukprot:4763310-Pleurochrysis_carterae.AAC.1